MSQPVQPTVPPLSSAETTPDHLALIIDIWKHSVSVQMHFNDMGMKIRNLYFTVLAAALGLIGVVQGKHIEIAYPPITVHLVFVVLLAVIPVSMLFFFLDAHWYHRLLLGAVKQCAMIEERYKTVLPEIQLGAAISKESPVRFGGVWRNVFWFIRDPRFRDPAKSNLHSDAKIEVLYKSVIWVVLFLAILYAFFGAIEYEHRSILALWLDP
jgi:hypothetical protein